MYLQCITMLPATENIEVIWKSWLTSDSQGSTINDCKWWVLPEEGPFFLGKGLPIFFSQRAASKIFFPWGVPLKIFFPGECLSNFFSWRVPLKMYFFPGECLSKFIFPGEGPQLFFSRFPPAPPPDH